ncbi:hypothetical protein DIPPA_24895 [Diplonema papillatum]|nr:hypothetical protein DIPPA_24895 [Diplonema papillatum]
MSVRCSPPLSAQQRDEALLSHVSLHASNPQPWLAVSSILQAYDKRTLLVASRHQGEAPTTRLTPLLSRRASMSSRPDSQWHLCWLLSLWEEKVTRTWLKREGVLVEEESSDGEEDTDGEAAAEEPGVASLLTEMRKEVAALRAEQAEAKKRPAPRRAVVYGELARRYAVAKGAQGHETEAHLKTLGIVLGAIGETETAFDADEALRKVAEAVLRRLEVVRIGQTAGWQEAEAAATAWEEDEAPDFLKKGLAAAEKMRRKKEKAKQGGNAFQKAKSSRGGEGRR